MNGFDDYILLSLHTKRSRMNHSTLCLFGSEQGPVAVFGKHGMNLSLHVRMGISRLAAAVAVFQETHNTYFKFLTLHDSDWSLMKPCSS
jgi:hypothetical protein